MTLGGHLVRKQSCRRQLWLFLRNRASDCVELTSIWITSCGVQNVGGLGATREHELNAVVSELVSRKDKDLHKLAIPNSGGLLDTGAGCRNRTDDLPLTRRVLYQLS